MSERTYGGYTLDEINDTGDISEYDLDDAVVDLIARIRELEQEVGKLKQELRSVLRDVEHLTQQLDFALDAEV